MKNDQKWYALKVISGKEELVKSKLFLELEQRQLRDYVGQVLIPAEKVYEMRAGKRQLRERSFYPGYLILQADLTDGRLVDLIKDLPNAIGFLGEGGWGRVNPPVPLRDKEVHKILGKMDELAADIGVNIDKPFIIGEMVKIVDGPFSGFSGSVQEIFQERKRLNIIVKIFERNTPIELTYAQVEKIM